MQTRRHSHPPAPRVLPGSMPGLAAAAVLALVAMLGSAWPGAPAQAMDSSGNYAVRGMGGKSCHSYKRAREQQEDHPYRDYLAGYLSAVNVRQEDTYSISGGQHVDKILLWLDEFCREQAMHSFEHALHGFVEAHQEQRWRKPPKPQRGGWGDTR